MSRAPAEALFQFMPYGAPELKEVARKYMFRGIVVGSVAWLTVFLASFGTNAFLKNRPHETAVVVVPYRELEAPPPLSDTPPPPQVQVAIPVAPPTVGVAVPVPDAAPRWSTHSASNAADSAGSEPSPLRMNRLPNDARFFVMSAPGVCMSLRTEMPRPLSSM